jgi:hypothetical protein
MQLDHLRWDEIAQLRAYFSTPSGPIARAVCRGGADLKRPAIAQKSRNGDLERVVSVAWPVVRENKLV